MDKIKTMKHLINIFCVLLFCLSAMAQDNSIDKGSGYMYFTDIPGITPNTGCCSELAFDTETQTFYHWNRDSSKWKRSLNITQQGGAPGGDPGNNPKIYLDTDTYKLYWWNGSGWDDLTTGGGGGGGAVSSVFGRTGAIGASSGDYNAGQITNTPSGNISATDLQAAITELDTEKISTEVDGSTTNEIQSLSMTADSIIISQYHEGINGATIDTIFALTDSTVRVQYGNGTQYDISIKGGVSGGGGGGTDDQIIDVLSLNGNNLEISLEDDGQATQTLDLSPINSDNQNLSNVLGQGNDAGGANAINLGVLSVGTTSTTREVNIGATGSNAELRVERTDGALFEISAESSSTSIGTIDANPLEILTNGNTRLIVPADGVQQNEGNTKVLSVNGINEIEWLTIPVVQSDTDTDKLGISVVEETDTIRLGLAINTLLNIPTITNLDLFAIYDSEGTQNYRFTFQNLVDQLRDSISVTAGAAEIDTFYNYTAFRATDNSVKLRFTTEEGKEGFWIPYFGAATDNGGDILETTGGQKYRRNKGADSELSWFEGTNSAEKINKAISSTDFGGKVYLENVEYEIEKPILLTGEKQLTVRGTNTTLKRANQVTVTIDETTTVGSSTIPVSTTTGLGVGYIISVITDNTNTGIQAFQDGGFDAVINSVQGDTAIVVNRTISADWNTYSLITNHSIIYSQAQKLFLNKLNLDGNGANFGANRSWKAGVDVVNNDYTEVVECDFNDSPHTGVIFPHGVIRGNTVDSTTSFIHITKAPQNDIAKRRQVIIEDNIVSYAGEYESECGHCEAVFETSQGGENITLRNNTVTESKNALIIATSDEKQLTISENRYINTDTTYTAKYVLKVTNDFTPTLESDDAALIVENNYFFNAGAILIAGANAANGGASYAGSFKGNTIHNGYLRLRGTNGWSVTDNKFYADSIYPYHRLKTDDGGTELDNFLIQAIGLENCSFRGNILYSSMLNDNLYGGYMLSNCPNTVTSGGEVVGFEVGAQFWDNDQNRQTNNKIIFQDVVIKVEENGSTTKNGAGVYGTRGVIVRNCDIYAVGANAARVSQFLDLSSADVGFEFLGNRYVSDQQRGVRIDTGTDADRVRIAYNIGCSPDAGLNPPVNDDDYVSTGDVVDGVSGGVKRMNVVSDCDDYATITADFYPTWLDLIRF